MEHTPETQRCCSSCGRTITREAKFCPYCGAQIPALVLDERLPDGITKKEFRKKYASPRLYKDLKTVGIWGYVLSAINCMVMLLVNPVGLVDALILLGLVFGTHLGRSKGCAIAMLVFSGFSTILTLALTGNLTGWMWLILGWMAVSTFRKIDREYEQRTTGTGMD